MATLRRKKIQLKKPVASSKNAENAERQTTGTTQLNFILSLEKKFPSSLKLFFEKICDRASFIKKGLAEKKELFISFLKKYGNISIEMKEWGAEIDIPTRKDGTVLIAHIGTIVPMGVFTNFYETLEAVLPQLENQLL